MVKKEVRIDLFLLRIPIVEAPGEQLALFGENASIDTYLILDIIIDHREHRSRLRYVSKKDPDNFVGQINGAAPLKIYNQQYLGVDTGRAANPPTNAPHFAKKGCRTPNKTPSTIFHNDPGPRRLVQVHHHTHVASIIPPLIPLSSMVDKK